VWWVKSADHLPALPSRSSWDHARVHTALLRDGMQGSPTLNAAFENVRAYKSAIESSKSGLLAAPGLACYARDESNTGVSVVARR